MKIGRSLDSIVGIPLVKALSWIIPNREPDSSSFKKILLIKLAAAGDTILLLPVVRAIRQAYPEVAIDWLVSPINRQLALLAPEIRTFHVLEKQTPLGLLQAASRLRAEHYDAVIDFEQWARGTALVAGLTGAPVRIGFDTPGQSRQPLFTRTYKKDFTRHEIDEFFSVASLLGPLKTTRELFLPEPEEGRAELSIHPLFHEAKAKKEPWILIHPGCGSDGRPREWPLENYAVLAHWLISKYHAHIFLTGGPEETFKTRNLKQLLRGAAEDFGGQLSWRGLIALVNRMDLVISGNTGVMHMAAALKKKQVALHGPTNPALWGPLNPNSRVVQSACPQCPCLRLGFEYHTADNSCMKKIEVSDVQAAVDSLHPFP